MTVTSEKPLFSIAIISFNQRNLIEDCIRSILQQTYDNIELIVCDDNSYMIAETDCKLLNVMNALGIETIQLGNSVNYLASETIPICSSKNGLIWFYKHYENLYQAS